MIYWAKRAPLVAITYIVIECLVQSNEDQLHPTTKSSQKAIILFIIIKSYVVKYITWKGTFMYLNDNV